MPRPSTQPLRAAVIGVGHLGRWHATKYAQLDGVDLVAVVDTDFDRATEVADECDCDAFSDLDDILGRVDCVSIASPTTTHFEFAKRLLENDVHVLVEKPITVSTSEARELIDLAAARRRVLQVGHIERFNAAFRGYDQFVARPRFIESHRLAPFTHRGADVSVVLDLMIHDIDLIMAVVNDDISEIRASGAAVITGGIDIANARIEFAGGCVANVTASRVSEHVARKLRIFQEHEYISIDFHKRQRRRHLLQPDASAPMGLQMSQETEVFSDHDALLVEIAAFVAAVRGDAPVVVDGVAGLRALEVAARITDCLQGNLAVMRPPMTH
ncbi:MAG: Gfo/Idh/MocA family protein [Thioalkalivibrionaceae bacterium]